MRRADLDNDPHVFDLSKRDHFTDEQKDIWRPAGSIPAHQIEAACQAYARGIPLSVPVEDAQIFEHRDFPGLQLITGLLPPETQVLFTSCLMHRDLAAPGHKINLQADYDIPYPPKSTSEGMRFDSNFFLRGRAEEKDCLKYRTSRSRSTTSNFCTQSFDGSRSANSMTGQLAATQSMRRRFPGIFQLL
jgi:alkylated DNA repair protein alkB family protein 1